MIIPERLRSRHDRGYERVMQTGETSYGDRLLQVPALRHNGTPLSIAFTVSLVHDALRSPVGVAAVLARRHGELPPASRARPPE